MPSPCAIKYLCKMCFSIGLLSYINEHCTRIFSCPCFFEALCIFGFCSFSYHFFTFRIITMYTYMSRIYNLLILTCTCTSLDCALRKLQVIHVHTCSFRLNLSVSNLHKTVCLYKFVNLVLTFFYSMIINHLHLVHQVSFTCTFRHTYWLRSNYYELTCMTYIKNMDYLGRMFIHVCIKIYILAHGNLIIREDEYLCLL